MCVCVYPLVRNCACFSVQIVGVFYVYVLHIVCLWALPMHSLSAWNHSLPGSTLWKTDLTD
jgi:hypothetical protein